MKNFTKIFVVAIVAALCFAACHRNTTPYTCYIVEGRIIDKMTKEPVKGIDVTVYKPILPNQEDKQNVKFKLSPIEHGGSSDANGNFQVLDTHYYGILYFAYYNDLYKDTTIVVDFSNVTKTGTPSGNYKGEYVLDIGDIEVERENYVF